MKPGGSLRNIIPQKAQEGKHVVGTGLGRNHQPLPPPAPISAAAAAAYLGLSRSQFALYRSRLIVRGLRAVTIPSRSPTGRPIVRYTLASLNCLIERAAQTGAALC